MEYVMKLFSEAVKLFALLTPPAVLSAFLSASKSYDTARKRATARKTALSVFIIGCILYFMGDRIFAVFGFTLDAFRIGSGTLLFLSAVSLMNESPEKPTFSADDDISVVPLAIPLCMGPASIGTLMVLGASAASPMHMALGLLALLFASLGIYATLYFATAIGNALGKTGIAVLSKLTGLLLAGIAAQVIFTGIKSFFQ
ncbi:MarC family protein [Desulfovibrio sp. OttesenSCG-928-I05]|nr:MarC family protein [Desulfovibrio sp. OttesenSCG-928-I05]